MLLFGPRALFYCQGGEAAQSEVAVDPFCILGAVPQALALGKITFHVERN